MGLVFLDYPANADDLQINHINGIKGDDKPDNLEWVTCSENIKHAFESGLKNISKPVLVENVLNNSTEIFKSAKECCLKFGFSQNVFSRSLTRKPWVFEQWPYRFSYYRDEDKDVKNKRTTKVLVRDMRTNSIVEYSSVVECSKALGISHLVIQSRLDSKFDKIYPDGLQIRRKKEVSSWYQPENLEKAIAEASRKAPCEIRYISNGGIVKFSSQREARKFLGLSETAIHVWLNYNGERVFKTKSGDLVQVRRCSEGKDWKKPDDPEKEYDLSRLREKRVIVRDIRDNKDVVYESALECAKTHKILATTLNYRLVSKGQKVFDGRYMYKYTTEELPFKSVVYVPSRREARCKLP